MDTVTYPDAEVRAELGEHWLDTHLDVTEAREVAALCRVAAIPTAVAATSDGTVLGRVQGFMAPEAFQNELQALRSKR